ncbi:MAG: DDE-type integrase/transposase/recombinase [Verrucomicrobia subdivision 3 bacterium]|nr:DDE-type integrase/transposase/recombinase [Limisphaerales bacterium]
MAAADEMQKKERWARLRFAIIGPLLAAPPSSPGELRRTLQQLAGQSFRHPITGLPVRFAFATLERWYYAARKAQDPVAVLRRRTRSDAGRTRRLPASWVPIIRAQVEAHPGWTVQLHYDNLKTQALDDDTLEPLPSYGTIRRYLKAQGYQRRRPPKRTTPGADAAVRRLETREVRSFEAEYTHALWHSDFHHGSHKVLTRAGQWITPVLLGIIDDHSRLVCHLQWYRDETAETLVHGLCQAFQKRGLPRALMTDNGAAMQADEFRQGLHTLSILHETTLPYSPYQNAKQESFWATLEGRLMAMLESVADLSLTQINKVTQAWVEQEYHRTLHREIGVCPLRRYLDSPRVGRDCPDSVTLRRAFRSIVTRRQRRSDGTVSLAGIRFEVPARYRHLETLPVSVARWDLRAVELIDPETLNPLCALHPLDKTANADAQRRRIPSEAAPTFAGSSARTSAQLPPLLKKLLADYAATGLPPAYLPKHDEEENPS